MSSSLTILATSDTTAMNFWAPVPIFSATVELLCLSLLPLLTFRAFLYCWAPVFLSLLPLFSSFSCLYCLCWAPCPVSIAAVELLLMPILPLLSSLSCLYCRWVVPVPVSIAAIELLRLSNVELLLQSLLPTPSSSTYVCYHSWSPFPVSTAADKARLPQLPLLSFSVCL
jgi:hypothetical protein